MLQKAQKVKPPTIDHAKELELETEIRELQRDEVLRNEERRLQLVDRASEKQHGQGLTGWVKWIEIKLHAERPVVEKTAQPRFQLGLDQ